MIDDVRFNITLTIENEQTLHQPFKCLPDQFGEHLNPSFKS